MQSIGVLTIGEEQKHKEDLIKVIEAASDYFPTETWDTIEYVGKLRLEHDLKIAMNNSSNEAFLFQKLINKVRRMKSSNKSSGLLLGITSNPIVAMYHFFDRTSFKRAIFLVHDYVDENVGVVSFFHVNNKFSSKLVAHGLGHNRGLRHHTEPIDLMYSELLRASTLQVDGFCEACQRKLTEETTNTGPHTH